MALFARGTPGGPRGAPRLRGSNPPPGPHPGHPTPETSWDVEVMMPATRPTESGLGPSRWELESACAMGLLPETVFGRDIDDVFSYPTIKYVNIRDRRLGLVKWVLTLITILYVVLYSLWYNGLYLESSPLTGACRFTLQQPTVGDCDPTKPGCENDYGRPADAHYCAQSTAAYDGNKSPPPSGVVARARAAGRRGRVRT